MIVYAVNDYVWALLQKKLGWTKITTKNLIPIFPAQQVPEAMNNEKPFIVYASSLEFNDGDLEPEDREIISYVIYSGSPDKEDDIADAVTLLKNAFKSFSSSDNINTWINNPDNEISPVDRQNMITFTQVMNADTSGGETSEGGKVDGFVQVRVGYHTNPEDYSI